MESIFSDLSDEDLALKAEIDEFLLNEVASHVNDIDQGKKEIWDVIRPMGEKGLLGIPFPEKYGGRSGPFKHDLIMSEAVCYYSLAIEMSRTASVYPAFMIRRFGKSDVLRKYIGPLIKGEKIGCFCFTEPDAGSDLSRMKTIYQKDEVNNEFVLNGEKRFITNGSIADTLVVYGRNGAFIVESEWDGFEVIEEYKMMGLHGLHLGHIKFNNVRIPKENELFYKETKSSDVRKTSAISSMQDVLGPERIVIAVQALSVAKRAIDVAIQYSQERIQFKRPISEFEGINFKIAQMVSKFEAGKALMEKSLKNLRDGYLAAMAKLFASTNSYEICDEAIQILGGIGYTNKYPVERCARDVRLLRIGGGTDEIMQYIIQKGLYKSLHK